MGGQVPVGEKEGDKEEGIEDEIEDKSPSDEADWCDCMDYAFTLGLIRLIG